jgi:hypothetical protein
LVEIIGKLLPFDIASLVLAGIVLKDELELVLRERYFGHVEAQSELIFGDIAMSELVKVFHELRNSDSLLFDLPSNSTKQVIKVLRHLASDGGFVGPRLLFEIDKATGVVFRDVFGIFIVPVDILDELVVVYLVEVPAIHVLFKEKIELSGVLRDEFELLQNTGELVLGYISNLCDVKVLEQGLQV